MDAPECAKNGKLFSANPKADCRLAFNASLYIDGFGANDGLLALNMIKKKSLDITNKLLQKREHLLFTKYYEFFREIMFTKNFMKIDFTKKKCSMDG